MRGQWVSRHGVLLVRFSETGPLVEVAGLRQPLLVGAADLSAVRGEAGDGNTTFEVELTWRDGSWLVLRGPVQGSREPHGVSGALLRRLQERVEGTTLDPVTTPTGRVLAGGVAAAVAGIDEMAALMGPRLADHSWSQTTWQLVGGSPTGHSQLVSALAGPGPSERNSCLSTSTLRRLFIAQQVAPSVAAGRPDATTDLHDARHTCAATSPEAVDAVLEALAHRLASTVCLEDEDWGSVVVGLSQAVPTLVAGVLGEVERLAAQENEAPSSWAGQWALVAESTQDLLQDLGVDGRIKACHTRARAPRPRQIVLG